MFERFTPRARHAVVLAQEEARALQHNYIGTEHLLLGMLGESDGIGARVLQRFDVTLADARDEVVAKVGSGEKALDGHIPFTPRAKKVLELSLREALSLGHNYIGTEHVLLGLVREQEGVGAQIIAAHVPEPVEARVRVAVLDLLPTPTNEPKRRWLRRRPRAVAGEESAVPEELDTTPAADTTLAEAARLAGAQPVGSQHLMLAALDDPQSAAARALTSIGIDLDDARTALRGVDIIGTSDEAPEDVGRRYMRVRVGADAVVVEATDPMIIQLGRAVVDSLDPTSEEAGTLTGENPVTVSLATVWRALHDSLDDIRRRITAGDPPAESGADPGAGEA
jgi:ATP-dependent Clp protease ATP-binding subunit ClpC